MTSAFMYAREKHEGQMYGDKPYLEHLSQVANKVIELNKHNCDREMQYKLSSIGWLHDVVEDCNVTSDNLINEGFSVEIVDAVIAITKNKEETRSDYINRCSKNPLALLVKIADTLCNLEASIKSNEANRIKKYCKQLDKLYPCKSAINLRSEK